VKWIG